MKATFKLLPIALLALLSACSGNSPEKTGNAFMDAFFHQNISEIQKVVTKESVENFQKTFENLDQSSAEKLDNTKYTFVSQEVIGETAFVKFLVNNAAHNNDTMTLKMVKEGGSWKVSDFQ